MHLGDYISTIPKDESFLLGADLNGHVGKVRDDADDCQATMGMESAMKKAKGFMNSQEHMALCWQTPTSRRKMSTSSHSLAETQGPK